MDIKQDVLVTPAKAEEYLASQVRNRRVYRRAVEGHAAAMREGRWVKTGETIKFDTKGQLIDGQHRLRAVVLCGIPQKMDLAFGIKPGSQDVMDTGKPRSKADTMDLHGIPNALQVAPAVVMLHDYEAGYLPGGYASHKSRIDNEQALAYLEAHPGLLDSVRFIQGSTMPKTLGSSSTLSFCHYLMERDDADKVTEFWQGLESGVGLVTNSPMLKLREALIANRYARAKISRPAVAAIILKAWIAFKSGRSISRLYWTWNGSRPEPFPRLD